MKKFEIVPELATADVCFRAFGSSIEEVFENAALAMFEIIVDTKKVKQELVEKIKIESEDLEALLFDFLSELIYLHDVKNLVFSKFNVKVEKNKKYHLFATMEGCKMSGLKLRGQVKAVTYHLMQIKQEKGIWTAQVILDM